MIKIEFKNNKIETFSGISQKNNKPFTIFKQVGWLHGTEDYPLKIEVVLKDDKNPYASGFYRLDIDSSLYVDRNNRLAVSPVLVVISEKASA